MAKVLNFPVNVARRKGSNIDRELLRAQGGAQILVFTGVFYSRVVDESCDVARDVAGGAMRGKARRSD